MLPPLQTPAQAPVDALNWRAQFEWLAARSLQLDTQLQPVKHEYLILLGSRYQQMSAAGKTQPAKVLIDFVNKLFEAMGAGKMAWDKEPKIEAMPLIAAGDAHGFLLLHARNPDGTWMAETPEGLQQLAQLPNGLSFNSVVGRARQSSRGTARQLFKQVLRDHKSFFMFAALATVIMNMLALVTSLYSMQVYDRVIPSQGVDTLFTLTSGVLITIVLETMTKFMRSTIMDQAIERMDIKLSYNIFDRLLRVRMDQFPASVGTLSGQLRSYEMIRSFISSVAVYLIVDTPFALLFLAVIFMVGGPFIAAIPLTFFLICLGLGFFFKGRIEAHAKASQAASNRKLGLLVETVETAEFIKASNAAWHFQGKWNALTRRAMSEDSDTRVGTATVTGTSWTFTPATVLADGAYTFKAMVQPTSDTGGTNGRVVSASNVITVSGASSAPTQTATITTVTDDVATNGSVTGTVSAGTTTDDNVLALAGSVSAALSSGQQLAIYDGGTRLGYATVSGTSWTFTTPALSNAEHYLSARVENTVTGTTGASSAAFNVLVDTGMTMTLYALTGNLILCAVLFLMELARIRPGLWLGRGLFAACQLGWATFLVAGKAAEFHLDRYWVGAVVALYVLTILATFRRSHFHRWVKPIFFWYLLASGLLAAHDFLFQAGFVWDLGDGLGAVFANAVYLSHFTLPVFLWASCLMLLLEYINRNQQARQIRDEILNDIHDGVGARLNVLLMGLELRALDWQAVKTDVRRCIDELRFVLLPDEDKTPFLIQLMEKFCVDLSDRLQKNGIDFRYSFELDKRHEVSPKVALVLYFSLLECLSNVVKHACHGARAVHCVLQAQGEGLTLHVHDDGPGIEGWSNEAQAFVLADARRGLGLKSLRARVTGAGGRLSIHSETGLHTRIRIDFPLNPPAV